VPQVSDEQTCAIIRRQIAKLGYVPSYSQMASELGLSKGSIQELVARLESKGLITRAHDKARTLRLTDADLPPDMRPVIHRFPPGMRFQEDKFKYTVMADIWSNIRRVSDPDRPEVPSHESELLEAKHGFEIIIRKTS
jgi:SOS-response transcriptional repressor LexA